MDTTAAPEWNALLLLVRCAFATDEEAEAALASADPMSVDWARVSRLADMHKVAALAHRGALRLPATAQPPPAVVQRLRQRRIATTAQWMRSREHLVDGLAALGGAGVAVIVLKGAHLAEFVYPAQGLRTMVDMDLLVRYQDVPSATSALASAGYVPLEQWHSSHDRMHHIRLVGPDAAHQVDLHWRLASKDGALGTADMAGVWRRAEPCSISGSPALRMAPADLLVHLAMHICSHRMEFTLRRLCDLHAVAQAYGGASFWSQVVERAGEWRVRRGLWVLLQLSRGWFCTPVPDGLFAELAPDTGRGAHLVAVARRLFEQGSAMTDRERIVRLIARRTRRDGGHRVLRGASGVWRALFPSPLEMALRYRLRPGHPALWLRYLSRLPGLVRRYRAVVVWAALHRGLVRDALRREDAWQRVVDWVVHE